jgi:hypothetical protein
MRDFEVSDQSTQTESPELQVQHLILGQVQTRQLELEDCEMSQPVEEPEHTEETSEPVACPAHK